MRLFLTIIALGLLTGCTASEGPLKLEEQISLLNKDMDNLFSAQKLEEPISLYDAITRAMEYNLDFKIKQMEEMVARGEVDMEQFKALPAVNLEGVYTGRNKERASSSRSILTGSESLEPSISSPRYNKTASLEASWNILDAGLSIARAKQLEDQALIQSERYRKVIHKIVSDVRVSYWNAASAQLLSNKVDELFADSQATLDKIKLEREQGLKSREEALRQQSRILRGMTELSNMRDRLSFAKIELANKINLPPNADFSLNVSQKDFEELSDLPEIKTLPGDLITLALIMRPEMRQEQLQSRINKKNVERVMLETLPGLEFAFGYHHDTNKFLENKNWTAFSASLADNLVKLFTLPARLDHQKNKNAIADMRRKALAATITSQVHMGLKRYELAKEQYTLKKELYTINKGIIGDARAKSEAEIISRDELMEIEIDTVLSQVRMHMAYIEVQNAYADILTTLGLDPVAKDVQGMTREELAKNIEERFRNLDDSALSAYIYDIKKIQKEIKTSAQPQDYAPYKPLITSGIMPPPWTYDTHFKYMVKNVQVAKNGPDGAQIVVELNDKVDFTIHDQIALWNELVVDLPKVAWDASLNWKAPPKRMLTSYEAESIDDNMDGTRIRFQTSGNASLDKAEMVPTGRNKDHNLVIDLKQAEPARVSYEGPIVQLNGVSGG